MTDLITPTPTDSSPERTKRGISPALVLFTALGLLLAGAIVAMVAAFVWSQHNIVADLETSADLTEEGVARGWLAEDRNAAFAADPVFSSPAWLDYVQAIEDEEHAYDSAEVSLEEIADAVWIPGYEARADDAVKRIRTAEQTDGDSVLRMTAMALANTRCDSDIEESEQDLPASRGSAAIEVLEEEARGAVAEASLAYPCPTGP